MHEGGYIMNEREFSTWLAEFRESIADYSYYTDFEKVYKNVDKIKIELNILNSLIGSQDIRNEFRNLMNRYPETIKCIPILLAVRAKEIYCQDDSGAYIYNFDLRNEDEISEECIERYEYFMGETGLFNLLERRLLSNIHDYVTGVETGLDSNARKNRGGHLMEDLVEEYIRRARFIEGETYFKEICIHEMTEKWGVDLSAISNQGQTEKRFDFVVKTDNMIYLIETNFYKSGGSKLNETARSYKNIAIESREIEGVTFVWFTDGIGWLQARNNLKEAFDVMPDIYNINELENNIMKRVFV